MKKAGKWLLIFLVGGIVMMFANEFRAIGAKKVADSYINGDQPEPNKSQATQDVAPSDDAEIIGDWKWGRGDDDVTFFAATSDSQERIFVKWCDVNDLACTYFTYLFSECAYGEVKELIFHTARSSRAINARCGGPREKGGSFYYVEGHDVTIVDQLIDAENLAISVENKRGMLESTEFSLSGASQSVHAMTRKMERVRGILDAIRSIPELKGWADNGSPEFIRAIEIDDELKASSEFSDLSLRERFLIVVDRVKREQAAQ